MRSSKALVVLVVFLVALVAVALYFYFTGKRAGVAGEQADNAAASVVLAEKEFENASTEIERDVDSGDAAALRKRILRLAAALNARR